MLFPMGSFEMAARSLLHRAGKQLFGKFGDPGSCMEFGFGHGEALARQCMVSDVESDNIGIGNVFLS
jgi:hypothetical protein